MFDSRWASSVVPCLRVSIQIFYDIKFNDTLRRKATTMLYTKFLFPQLTTVCRLGAVPFKYIAISYRQLGLISFDAYRTIWLHTSFSRPLSAHCTMMFELFHFFLADFISLATVIAPFIISLYIPLADIVLPPLIVVDFFQGGSGPRLLPLKTHLGIGLECVYEC